MGYNRQGLYNAYKKNNTEREKLDYYSTPSSEVANILKITEPYIRLRENTTILEPCIGGGHMYLPILDHFSRFVGDTIGPSFIEGVEWPTHRSISLIGTDIMDRGFRAPSEQGIAQTIEYGLDFLSDNYPYNKADILIMNPPYMTIEPFVLRALDIAPVVLMLARTQFTESQSRYENIFKEQPPTHIFQYVDRIACYRNGDETITGGSAQAYAWFLWDQFSGPGTQFHWIRRSDKS